MKNITILIVGLIVFVVSMLVIDKSLKNGELAPKKNYTETKLDHIDSVLVQIEKNTSQGNRQTDSSLKVIRQFLNEEQ